MVGQDKVRGHFVECGIVFVLATSQSIESLDATRITCRIHQHYYDDIISVSATQF